MNNNAVATLKAVSIAVVLAGVILTTIVLPAEYGIDPLGTGALLGLQGLSKDTQASIVIEEQSFASDEISFVLGTYESVEYKYETGKDASILFHWQATAPVSYDFHGEPEDGPEGFAESYDIGKAESGQGSFRAPFPGIHGWYFENRNFSEVTVTLITSGFYTKSHTFRDGFVETRVIEPD